MSDCLREASASWTPDDILANGYTVRQIANAITPQLQQLIILPTEKCNLRCTYCYEDYSIGKMSDETQSAIEALICRRVPDLKRLLLTWFGGEPLVAKDVVLRLSRYAKKVCAQHEVAFSGSMTTNAYLLNKPLFEDLLECDQNSYQVTLDGWRTSHDSVRKFADGRGTFDQIWENLIAAKSIAGSFAITLRVHVRRDNIDALPELMREIANTFGADKRYRMDFQHLRNMGGEGGRSIKKPVGLEEVRKIEASLREIYRDALAASENSKGASAETSVAALAEGEPEYCKSKSGCTPGSKNDPKLTGEYICYAAKPNSLLIRADGRIGKCTVHFLDRRNDIGHLKNDGTLEIDNSKLKPWIRGVGSLEAGDLRCPISLMDRE